MLNKEEIEKVKYRLEFDSSFAGMPNDCCIVNQNDIKKLLQYIQHLESKVKGLEIENEMFKDFYTSCGNKDIADNITATQYCKIREDAYWEGYIKKQNEAMEICKICKYRTKLKKLEEEKQEVVGELKKTRNNLERDGFVGYADEIQDILDLYNEGEQKE